MDTEFIKLSLSEDSNVWSIDSTNMLSHFDIPDTIYGRRKNILKGDINRQWAKWFIEGLVDPRSIANSKLTYPFVFEKVLESVNNRYHNNKTKPEKIEIASLASKIAFQISNYITEDRKRNAISLENRKLLLDLSGSPPRCWICGAMFKEYSIDLFLSGIKHEKIDNPPFIDILKPTGLNQRDYSIEIDHIVPFSRGGNNDDNLKLSCGWCNRYKSSYMSVYEVEGQPRIAGKNLINISSLPHPFWIVRLLGLIKKCEHSDGCSCTTENSELTVAPIQENGAMNPSNLMVTCYEHDPLKRKRLQPPNIVKKVWNI